MNYLLSETIIWFTIFFFSNGGLSGGFTLCSKSLFRRFGETFCLCRADDDLVQLSAEVTEIKECIGCWSVGTLSGRCDQSELRKVKVKVKLALEQATKAQKGEYRYSYTLSLTSTLDGSGCSTPRPRRFNPGKAREPMVCGAGWAPEPVWTGAENFAPPTGIRSPDRPARSESLYRLSYRGSELRQTNTMQYILVGLAHLSYSFTFRFIR